MEKCSTFARSFRWIKKKTHSLCLISSQFRLKLKAEKANENLIGGRDFFLSGLEKFRPKLLIVKPLVLARVQEFTYFYNPVNCTECIRLFLCLRLTSRLCSSGHLVWWSFDLFRLIRACLLPCCTCGHTLYDWHGTHRSMVVVRTTCLICLFSTIFCSIRCKLCRFWNITFQ